MAGLTCFHTSVIFEVWPRCLFAVLSMCKECPSLPRVGIMYDETCFIICFLLTPNDTPINLDDMKVEDSVCHDVHVGDGDIQLSTLAQQSDSDLSVSFPPRLGLQAEDGEHQPPLSKRPRMQLGANRAFLT